MQDDIRDMQEKINALQEKIKLLDCEDKNFDQILEELNNQRREQEKVFYFSKILYICRDTLILDYEL